MIHSLERYVILAGLIFFLAALISVDYLEKVDDCKISGLNDSVIVCLI